MEIILSTIFSLIGLSIPIFYIFGLVSFLRQVVTKTEEQGEAKSNYIKKDQTASDLALFKLIKLEQLAQSQPELTLEQALKGLNTTNSGSNQPGSFYQTRAQIEIKPGLKNWYTDNSINLLLYLGAFLIVSASLIFVGFQWGFYTGFIKSILVTVFCFVWLIAGSVF